MAPPQLLAHVRHDASHLSAGLCVSSKYTSTLPAPKRDNGNAKSRLMERLFDAAGVLSSFLQ